MPEPGREAWVTFSRDPKGLDTLTKGTHCETQGWGGGCRPRHVDGLRHWGPNKGVTHSPQLCHRRQEDNCLHPISYFSAFIP